MGAVKRPATAMGQNMPERISGYLRPGYDARSEILCAKSGQEDAKIDTSIVSNAVTRKNKASCSGSAPV